MTSKQIRAEVLPVFFAECTFTDDVVSNYPVADALDELVKVNQLRGTGGSVTHSWMAPITFATSAAGELQIQPRTKKWLRDLEQREGIVPVFRNLRFSIHGPVEGTGRISTSLDEKSAMRITVPTAIELTPAVTFDGLGQGSKQPEQLAIARQRATAVAESLAGSKQKFLGFIMGDVEKIAKCFRYWPDDRRTKPPKMIGSGSALEQGMRRG